MLSVATVFTMEVDGEGGEGEWQPSHLFKDVNDTWYVAPAEPIRIEETSEKVKEFTTSDMQLDYRPIDELGTKDDDEEFKSKYLKNYLDPKKFPMQQKAAMGQLHGPQGISERLCQVSYCGSYEYIPLW